jgi:uncharacterized protein (TIGR00255 family)
MTGFGSSEYQDDRIQLSVEIKSYNNRYLDISMYLPSFLNVYESELRELVRSAARRGHVDVNIRMRHLNSDAEILVDEDLARKYRQAFSQVAAAAGIPDEPTLSHFVTSDELMKLVSSKDPEMYRDLIFEQTGKALDIFAQSRKREGEHTLRDISDQVDRFSSAHSRIAAKADGLERMLQENLQTRFDQILTEEYDQSRILQEVALLLNKYTIHEEIQRISSHLEHMRSDMISDEPIGKRLDFLCQELNREINTIASKSVIAEVNQEVVTMKDMLENIREQLRNVE